MADFESKIMKREDWNAFAESLRAWPGKMVAGRSGSYYHSKDEVVKVVRWHENTKKKRQLEFEWEVKLSIAMGLRGFGPKVHKVSTSVMGGAIFMETEESFNASSTEDVVQTGCLAFLNDNDFKNDLLILYLLAEQKSKSRCSNLASLLFKEKLRDQAASANFFLSQGFMLDVYLPALEKFTEKTKADLANALAGPDLADFNELRELLQGSRQIGEGSFGVVFKLAAESGKQRAAKLVNFFEADEKTLFEEEVVLGREMAAIGVGPEIYQSATTLTEGIVFMDAYDQDLWDSIEGDDLSEKEKEDVCGKWLDAVGRFAKSRYMCTDIKGENAVMKGKGKDTEVRLIDFGYKYCTELEDMLLVSCPRQGVTLHRTDGSFLQKVENLAQDNLPMLGARGVCASGNNV